MFFRSTVDSWIYVFAISLPLIIMSIIAPNLADAKISTVLYVGLAIAPFALIPAWLLISTYYRVDSNNYTHSVRPFLLVSSTRSNQKSYR